jgi:hypothetical protein
VTSYTFLLEPLLRPPDTAVAIRIWIRELALLIGGSLWQS